MQVSVNIYFTRLKRGIDELQGATNSIIQSLIPDWKNHQVFESIMKMEEDHL